MQPHGSGEEEMIKELWVAAATGVKVGTSYVMGRRYANTSTHSRLQLAAVPGCNPSNPFCLPQLFPITKLFTGAPTLMSTHGCYCLSSMSYLHYKNQPFTPKTTTGVTKQEYFKQKSNFFSTLAWINFLTLGNYYSAIAMEGFTV